VNEPILADQPETLPSGTGLGAKKRRKRRNMRKRNMRKKGWRRGMWSRKQGGR
jgi:hypothetical protein